MRKFLASLFLIASFGLASAQTTTPIWQYHLSNPQANDIFLVERAPGGAIPSASVCSLSTSNPCYTVSVPIGSILGQIFSGSDQAPVNPNNSPYSEPTFNGSPTYLSKGNLVLNPAHMLLNGQTLGWDNAACILTILANQPDAMVNTAGTQSACGPSNYGDFAQRMAQGTQDTKAMFVAINGITPMAKAAAIRSMSSANLLNLGGVPQTVGTLVLSSALSTKLQGYINNPTGPIRIAINNYYFGYIIPPGFTTIGGSPVSPITSDGKTIYVDNWTRSITSADGTTVSEGACPALSRLRGHIAACPTFPWTSYATGSPVSIAGTGIFPNMVGQANGSAALGSYTALIGGNDLADDFYTGFSIDDNDSVTAARVMEIAALMGKAGTTVWNERGGANPSMYYDTINGIPTNTDLLYGGCSQNSGYGNGVCSSFLHATAGLKRVIECDNPQTTMDEGGTDCILDTQSVFGYHTTKTGGGFALYVDPGATGSANLDIDWNGVLATKTQIVSTSLITANALQINGYAAFGQGGVHASGSTQGTAAPITSQSALVLSASAGSSGIILPVPSNGTTFTIINPTNYTVMIYPPVGANFGSFGPNIPFPLPPATGPTGPAGAAVQFNFLSGTTWWPIAAVANEGERALTAEASKLPVAGGTLTGPLAITPGVGGVNTDTITGGSNASLTMESCGGTGASGIGSNLRGVVTTGTTATSSCTFSLPQPFTHGATCVFSRVSATGNMGANPTAANSASVTALFGSSVASAIFSYICLN